jgi:hypothetical protein
MWDGVSLSVAKAFLDDAGAGISNYTDEVNDEDDSTYMDLATFDTTNAIYLGFTQKMRGFIIDLAAGQRNANKSGVSVQYWAKNVWSGVTGLYDGTNLEPNHITLRFSGIIHWIPTEEVTAEQLEFKRMLKTTPTTVYPEAIDNLFWYRITIDASASAPLYIAEIDGIPATPARGDVKTIDKYRFPISFQERLFLVSHKDKVNTAIYSAYEQPDVFNGTDSDELIFGDLSPITSGGVIYNLFRTTGFEQLILAKANALYRLFGDGPENWETQQISDNEGCVAPASFVTTDVFTNEEGVTRNVAICQSDSGFIMIDGATPRNISSDINIYFDSSDSRRIKEDRIDDTYSWYDSDTNTYHALITSANYLRDAWGDGDEWQKGDSWQEESSVTRHNVELEYSLSYNEWTKIYREDNNGSDFGSRILSGIIIHTELQTTNICIALRMVIPGTTRE